MIFFRKRISSISDIHLISCSDWRDDWLSYELEVKGKPIIGFDPKPGKPIEVSFAPAVAKYIISLDILKEVIATVEALAAEDATSEESGAQSGSMRENLAALVLKMLDYWRSGERDALLNTAGEIQDEFDSQRDDLLFTCVWVFADVFADSAWHGFESVDSIPIKEAALALEEGARALLRGDIEPSEVLRRYPKQ